MRPALPWIIALVGSVLINGALVGYLVHRSTDGPRWQLRQEYEPGTPPRGGPTGRGGFDLRGFVEALPDEARDEARSRLRDSFAGMRDIVGEGRDARRELDALLVAEEFDADAVAAAMARMRESQRTMEARIEAVVLDVVAGLDAETRAAALQAGRDRIGREARGRRGPRRDRRDEPRPPAGQ
ncbi:periplasmic heavy metal sensor [Maricaulis maris]|uniref:Heavy-metal resistance protein n=1 Tax=Maricaulis maris TaxID=74318 RepID=A0A495D1C9_9PROT|nr:periplasmic heavy metal sensor [Maricaulis maris]RKQ95273.1 heavy-metal resistance protein [Maricaulis maris]